MRRGMVLVFCLLLPTSMEPLWAQSNLRMDTLLSQKSASFGEAVYLVMTATGRVSDSASIGEAIAALRTAHWGVRLEESNAPLTLGEFALLVMRGFDLQGGIMYRLFPGPRYAARELVYRKAIYGDPSPYRKVSGAEIVQILGNVMRAQGVQR